MIDDIDSSERVRNIRVVLPIVSTNKKRLRSNEAISEGKAPPEMVDKFEGVIMTECAFSVSQRLLTPPVGYWVMELWVRDPILVRVTLRLV